MEYGSVGSNETTMAKLNAPQGSSLYTPSQAISTLKGILNEKNCLPAVILYSGEEHYYFEQLEQLIIKHYGENVVTLYGNESSYSDIALEIQSTSLFVQQRAVILKEAEAVKDLDKLIPTLSRLPQGTSLILAYQGNMAFNAKKLFASFQTLPSYQTIIIVSPRITSKRTILSIINQTAKAHDVTITAEAADKLIERVGFDGVTSAKEVAKLAVLASDSGQIEANIVDFIVGVSIQYSVDDLCQALYKKQRREALTIAQYMTKDPANFPLPLIVATLYGFFSNLMVASYQKDRSEKALATVLNLKNAYQAKRYSDALWLFKAMQIFYIIHELRLADARLKGAEDGDYDYEGILFNLVYLILA